MELISSNHPLDIDLNISRNIIESYIGDIIQLDIGSSYSNELVFDNVLGNGNFGLVKKYIYKNKFIYGGQNVSVAVKEVLLDINILELDMEIKLMKKLPIHNNLISFLGVIVINGVKGIMLDFCELGSLDNMVRNMKIFNRLVEDNNLLKIIRDIALGMESLHHSEILHCDLATRNILISGNLNGTITAKISDFGLSQQLEEIDAINTVLGTIRFNEEIQISPRNIPIRWCHPKVVQSFTYNKQTDIWSFACTIIEILDRGIYPFKNKSNNEVIDYLTNDQYNGLSMLISMNGILAYSLQEKNTGMLAFLIRCLNRNSQSLSFGELIQNLGSIHNIENIYAYNYTRQHTLFRYPEGYDTSPDIDYIEIQNDPFEIIQEEIVIDDDRRLRVIEP